MYITRQGQSRPNDLKNFKKTKTRIATSRREGAKQHATKATSYWRELYS
jgi:hypothetical protein